MSTRDEEKKIEIAKRIVQRAIDDGSLVRLPSGNLIEPERLPETKK